MRSFIEHPILQGAAGDIELLLDLPELPAKGTAVIAHPHPLFGGTMDNKVVQTLARAFVQAGWKSVRFNFRGIGKSAGTYDAGIGETEDLLTVLKATRESSEPFALAGFSFGGFVTLNALQRLEEKNDAPQSIVLVGAAASRFALPPLKPEWHARTLVIHGETDDVVPFSAILDWARPQTLPLTVIPGGGHFFHGQLTLLKERVLSHLQAGSLS